jgi:protein-arginine kinase activator protein McsA
MTKKDQLNNLSQNSTEQDLSQYYTCRSCGMKFDNFGDMQKHILVEHMQKGDIPSEDSGQVPKK